jgi:uncharacterized membrane protein
MSTILCYLQQSKLKGVIFAFLAVFILTPSYAMKGNDKPAKSSLTARLMNIEQTAKNPFRYSAILHNGNGQTQTYHLEALLPDGWLIAFKTEGNEVSSVMVDSGKTANLSLEIYASPEVKPGKYNIPVTAFSALDKLSLNLEAVVKGTYAVEISTPTGLLSGEVTEGDDKVLQLTVTNTGTLPLSGLSLSDEAPAKWTVTFDPSKLDRLDPGKTQTVNATVKVPDKTIAGDYATKFTVRNSYTNEDTTFRLTVVTSLLSGWIGILIILLALGLVYYLIRKYGRR